MAQLNSHQIGQWAEGIAANFLVEQGFQILSRNYRALRGEIDIIAQESQVISFVEVKYGNSEYHWRPEQRITLAKRKQLYRIATHYIQHRSGPEVDYRFDAVIIDGTPMRYQIRFYKNAFYIL